MTGPTRPPRGQPGRWTAMSRCTLLARIASPSPGPGLGDDGAGI